MAINFPNNPVAGQTFTSNGVGYEFDGQVWNLTGSNPFIISAAFDKANAAYGQANSANITADSAYAQANVARTHSNGAFDQANVTAAIANASFSRANNAVLKTGNTMTGNLVMSGANITFVDATNSGIYWSNTGFSFIHSPAANTLVFGTSSTEDMRIDANGNVGIATSNPSSFGKFAVQGASTTRAFYADALAQPVARYDDNSYVSNGLTIRNTGISGSNQGIGLLFQLGAGGTAVDSGAIQMRSEADYSTAANQDAAMLFFVVANGTNSERMRIDSSGNVGIGTTSPSSKLQIGSAFAANNATYVGSIQLNEQPSSLSAVGGLEFKTSAYVAGYGWKIVSIDSGSGVDLLLATRQNSVTWNESMRITSSGNVGIGTSSPGSPLQVVGAGRFGSSPSQTTGACAIYNDGNNATIEVFAGNNTGTKRNLLLQTYGGDVGIGTSSPGYKLDVAGSLAVGASIFTGTGVSTGDVALELGQFRTGSGHTYVDLHSVSGSDFEARFIRYAGANGNCGLYNTGTGLFEITQINAGALYFGTNSSERMRITSSGNVGIGTSSPKSLLHISGSLTLQQNYSTYLVNAYYDGSWKYVENGIAWGIGNNFGGPSNGVCIAAAASNSSGADAALTWLPRLNIDSSGNVGIGTTSPSSPGGTLNFFLNTATGTSIIKGATGSTTTGAARLDLATGTSNSYIIAGLQDNTGSPYFQLSAGSGVQNFYYDGPTHIWRNASGTERMRITAAGRLQFATTSFENGMLNISGYQDGGQYGVVMRPSANNSTPFRFENGGGGEVGTISCTTTGTSYVTTSDYRLKENIVPLTNAVARIQALKPSRFNFIEDYGRTIDGFIAHEVAEVVPEAVVGDKDMINKDGTIKPQGIDNSKLIPLLTAALQEALIEISALKSRVSILENP